MNLLAIIFILLYSSITLANNIELICPDKLPCSQLASDLLKEYESHNMPIDGIEAIKALNSMKKLSKIKIKSIRNSDGSIKYKIYATPLPTYKSINIEQSIPGEYNLQKILDINPGDPVDIKTIRQGLVAISRFLEEKGLFGIRIAYLLEGNKNNPKLRIIIQHEGQTIISKIVIKGDNKLLPKHIKDKLLDIQGQIFAPVQLKIQLDKIRLELVQRGFYNALVSVQYKEGKYSHAKIAYYNIKLGELTNISVIGNKHLARTEILKEIRKQNSDNAINKTTIQSIRNTIDKLYQAKGIYHSKMSINKQKSISNKGLSTNNFYVRIQEGHKVKISAIDFEGNFKISRKNIMNLFYDKASSIASRKYLDKKFLNQFREDLKSILNPARLYIIQSYRATN